MPDEPADLLPEKLHGGVNAFTAAVSLSQVKIDDLDETIGELQAALHYLGAMRKVWIELHPESPQAQAEVVQVVPQLAIPAQSQPAPSSGQPKSYVVDNTRRRYHDTGLLAKVIECLRTNARAMSVGELAQQLGQSPAAVAGAVQHGRDYFIRTSFGWRLREMHEPTQVRGQQGPKRTPAVAPATPLEDGAALLGVVVASDGPAPMSMPIHPRRNFSDSELFMEMCLHIFDHGPAELSQLKCHFQVELQQIQRVLSNNTDVLVLIGKKWNLASDAVEAIRRQRRA